jgi:hypothetical protein
MNEPLLFAAFLAGFDASGEGFNGEWLHERYRSPKALEERLRPVFDAWVGECGFGSTPSNPGNQSPSASQP